jgi:hypothetical protein
MYRPYRQYGGMGWKQHLGKVAANASITGCEPFAASNKNG